MPRVFDNIELKLLPDLQNVIQAAYCTGFCVGYFNWRGWKGIANRVDEWQVLYMRIHKSSVLPKTIQSAHQAIRWIAQPGGFLGRKSDGVPGIVDIWYARKKLKDLAVTCALIADYHIQVVGNR